MAGNLVLASLAGVAVIIDMVNGKSIIICFIIFVVIETL